VITPHSTRLTVCKFWRSRNPTRCANLRYSSTAGLRHSEPRCFTIPIGGTIPIGEESVWYPCKSAVVEHDVSVTDLRWRRGSEYMQMEGHPHVRVQSSSPRPGTKMPPFDSLLTPEDIRAIDAFVRSRDREARVT
jgi:hypothetical protein